MQRRRGAEADDWTVERDTQAGNARMCIDGALHQSVRDRRGAIEAVLGEGGFEDVFSRPARQRHQHPLRDHFR